MMKPYWYWLVMIGLAGVILFVPFPIPSTAPLERTVHIRATRFEYSPAVMTVNPGDRVTIELESTDVVHGLSIDGYGLSMTADPGQTTRMTFTAAKTGLFHFHCTVTCGDMHPFMTGKLQIGPNMLYWRAAALGLLVLGAGIGKLHA